MFNASHDGLSTTEARQGNIIHSKARHAYKKIKCFISFRLLAEGCIRRRSSTEMSSQKNRLI